MKVILNVDIKGVGKAGQILNANDGYARNYLLPKNLAKEANTTNLTNLKAKQISEKNKKDQIKQQAIDNSKKIAELILIIKVKAGDNGRIFGGVTTKEISEELLKQYDINVDKKKIQLNETIKTLGVFIVEIKLHEGVNAKLKVNVISE